MREELDVDQVVHDFLNMEMALDDLLCSHRQVKEEVEMLDKRCWLHTQSKQHSEEELKKFQELIEKYQKMLENLTTTKDENNRLKEDVAKVEKEKEQLEQDVMTTSEKFMKEIEELKRNQMGEVGKVQKQADQFARSEIRIYEDKLKDVTFEVEECKSLLVDKTKAHEYEVARIKLEYDTKIQKIQQHHLTIANTSSDSISASNEIFRKKLLHVQSECEKEVKDLKVQCSQQLQQISDQQHQLKLKNRQYQESTKKHHEQCGKQDKLLQQYQNQIQYLQNQLHHRDDMIENLQTTISEKQMPTSAKRPSGGKRKKVMFNPHKDRFSPPP